jgi:hypothetical protein
MNSLHLDREASRWTVESQTGLVQIARLLRHHANVNSPVLSWGGKVQGEGSFEFAMLAPSSSDRCQVDRFQAGSAMLDGRLGNE